MKNLSYLSVIALIFLNACSNHSNSYNNWNIYGGSKENIRYSSLTEIDTNTVVHLEKAWEYKTGDTDKFTQIQVNPIIVDNILYGVSPKLKLFAVDAATGQPKWTFDPYQITEQGVKGVGYFAMNVCRGVTYYSDKESKRIFYAAGSNLFCIDATNGKPITSFGNNGKLDLHNDLDRDVAELYIAMTSPGIIYKDAIIIGSRVNENANAAPGYIRAYDVHSGKLKWKFHTIPTPGEEGYDSWEDKEAWKNIGGVNAWAGFSLDEKRGILYAPLGSASYDFYGGKRLGANLFANSILALDAATGKKIWHFQTVHHDVWDRDLPTAPALVTIQKDGKYIDAIAQPTKSGFIYLLDRTNGQPIYPINEIKVPTQTALVGEKLSRTQPWPTVMKPFARQSFTEKDINPLIDPTEQEEIKKKLNTLHTGFIFNAPSKEGTVIFPGFDGGAEWGGPAYDPSSNLLYVNANEMPWILTMVDQKNEAPKKETIGMAGERLYKVNCMACHGPERKGGDSYPTLIGIEKKINEDSLTRLLGTGRRMMPAFAQLKKEEKEAIASFVLTLKNKKDKTYTGPAKTTNPYWEMPYNSTGYNKFITKQGYPAVAPPWGTLNAIDLNTGNIVWKDTLGDTPEFLAKGIHTGTENYGGPVVTSGGVLFIAATKDGMFRAFNKRTGKLIWETKLPYPGFATPAVYEINGKQYVVVACGGGKLGTPSGDVYIAFTLKSK
jgi:quinoprotein glucose dehydrogenase